MQQQYCSLENKCFRLTNRCKNLYKNHHQPRIEKRSPFLSLKRSCIICRHVTIHVLNIMGTLARKTCHVFRHTCQNFDRKAISCDKVPGPASPETQQGENQTFQIQLLCECSDLRMYSSRTFAKF